MAKPTRTPSDLLDEVLEGGLLRMGEDAGKPAAKHYHLFYAEDRPLLERMKNIQSWLRQDSTARSAFLKYERGDA